MYGGPRLRLETIAMHVLALVALVTASLGATNGGVVQHPRTIEDVIERTSRYLVEYGAHMSIVVGAERYAQWMDEEDVVGDSVERNRVRRWKRETVSEIALVRAGDDWIAYRDVHELDGKKLHDRQDRLERLFMERPAEVADEGRRIADESARYNLGPMQRNFNVPTMALFFAHPSNQHRFRFQKEEDARIEGTPVWRVAFEEVSRPTIIRTSSGRDMPVSGSLWIEPDSGRILRTHMEITGEVMASGSGDSRVRLSPAQRRIRTSASITVDYRHDTRLGLLLPSVMRESYQGLTVSAVTRQEATFKITSRATYSDFKRFDTTTRFTIPK